MKKTGIIAFAALTLSIPLANASHTPPTSGAINGNLTVNLEAMPKPTTETRIFTGDVAVKPVPKRWFSSLRGSQDVLENAIDSCQIMEVERIISAREFTQAEKDYYVRAARENIIRTKPSLEPGITARELLLLGGGTIFSLASLSGAVVSLGSTINSIVKARDDRDSMGSFAEPRVSSSRAAPSRQVSTASPSSREGEIFSVSEDSHESYQSPRKLPSLFGCIWNRFDRYMQGLIPALSIASGYLGYKCFQAYVKGCATQQAYNKAQAIHDLVAAIKVKA